ncbi:MAG: ribosome silencing factor [Gemmatimonadota bacterium]
MTSSRRQANDAEALAVRIADLALERKAENVVALDLRGISSATDFFVIASGGSDVHVRAIADHIVEELKKADVRPGHVEGLQSGAWVLVDYIDVVVHVFQRSVRDFYQLENLWGDAPTRDFEPEGPDAVARQAGP